jgi:hypothetical protein
LNESLSVPITSAREKDILEFKHEIDMINLILDVQTKLTVEVFNYEM